MKKIREEHIPAIMYYVLHVIVPTRRGGIHPVTYQFFVHDALTIFLDHFCWRGLDCLFLTSQRKIVSGYVLFVINRLMEHPYQGISRRVVTALIVSVGTAIVSNLLIEIKGW